MHTEHDPLAVELGLRDAAAACGDDRAALRLRFEIAADTIKQMRTVDDWLSIETAPKDGTLILIYRKQPGAHPEKYFIAGWDDGEWCDICAPIVEPTHWKPLMPPIQCKKSNQL